MLGTLAACVDAAAVLGRSERRATAEQRSLLDDEIEADLALGECKGALIFEHFAGYKTLIASGVTEIGCLAHARCKFFDLHAISKIQIAGFALQQFAKVYYVEREVKDLSADQRQVTRQQHTRPLLAALREWMRLQRQKLPVSSGMARVLDYSLRRWAALTRFADDGQLPVDNKWIENQIRPFAVGRNNGLFACSLRAGQHAAAVISLLQSARMNGNDPYAQLQDVLTRLPTHWASRVEKSLPHRCPAPTPDQYLGGQQRST